jgi:hypothetical protein
MRKATTVRLSPITSTTPTAPFASGCTQLLPPGKRLTIGGPTRPAGVHVCTIENRRQHVLGALSPPTQSTNTMLSLRFAFAATAVGP